ncbi:MAG: ferritin-like fold-containing protein [Rhodoglobus sp.]|uniref:ferritin-like fold-containing protein n=1 Tax=uncultured Salinibacterium sp. TaxID=459274 RepID=UPI0030DD8BC3
MVKWFSRKPGRIEVPRLRSRSDVSATEKVALAEFAPDTLAFLGRAAYVQLMIFENLSRVISTAPTTAAKTAIGKAAELSMAKHRKLVDEITKAGGTPAEVMDSFTDEVDEFDRIARGADWYESLLSAYLSAGFFDDFYARLAAGLPTESHARLVEVFRAESGEKVLAEFLQAAIDANPRLDSRLAMWGRRLMGDMMLLARSALVFPDHTRTTEAQVEPVFTELVAAHTRRMDALGLTA